MFPPLKMLYRRTEGKYIFLALICGTLIQAIVLGLFALDLAEAETESSIMELAVSPDGRKLVFVEYKGPWRAAFYWRDLKSNKTVFVGNEYATDSVSRNSDSDVFAFSSVQAPRDFERIALKTFGIQTGLESTIVTESANAYPAFSPVDRELLAFVRVVERKCFFLHLFDFKNKKTSLLIPEPLANDESWCWNSNGQEIFYCIKDDKDFLIRSVEISTFSSRDVLKLASAPDELQFIPEGQVLSILDSDGMVTLSSADGIVLDRIHPATGLYKGLTWRNSEQVAFLICKDETSSKCDLAVSHDRLKTFTRIAEHLRRPYVESSLLAWLTNEFLIYHDASSIMVVDKNGQHIRDILSLPLFSPGK